MAGPSKGQQPAVAARAPVTHETSAQCPRARWQLAVVGFVGYLISGFFVSMGIDTLLETAGVEIPVSVQLGIVLAFAVLAAWRGSTVSAIVRPTEVFVRNRWRSVTLPLGEIEAVETGSSVPYTTINVVDYVRYQFSSDSTTGSDMADPSDLLKIRRRGHRRRLPVYATLGMGAQLDDMQPFLDALAAAGHAVELAPPAPPVEADDI